jgi:tripeptide aminopeptidase
MLPKKEAMKQKILERFLRYVKIDTQAKDDVTTIPSTKKQFDLAKLLVHELKGLGLKNAAVDKNCYVYAALPATSSKRSPKIGLIAHLDTSPEVSGVNIHPRVIKNYQGGDIVLNKKKKVIIKASGNNDLKKCVGHTLVTSDGTALLGADDKAGVAAIITVMEELVLHPEIPHGEIRIAFTPDEEVGRGADLFNLKKFNADFAYTIDGGFIGELNKETFSAYSALITVLGRDIHPGTAKNIMVNSIRAMADIIAHLPKNMAPETTEGLQPYIHPMALDGSVHKTTCKLILRDFKTSGLAAQNKLLKKIIAEVRKLHPKAKITLQITASYRNMRDRLERCPAVTNRLWQAANRAGVEPRWEPVRGGTDGSRLTAMGLPTPNLFTGSGNHHSLTEWVSIDELAKAVETVINVVRVD